MLRIRDVYPGSRILIFTHPGSRIPDLGSRIQNSHIFHKIENYFSFEVLKKKIWANFQRIIELYTQKIVTKLSKISVWDPGSRGQKGTGSWIRNTAKMRTIEGWASITCTSASTFHLCNSISALKHRFIKVIMIPQKEVFFCVYQYRKINIRSPDHGEPKWRRSSQLAKKLVDKNVKG